MLCQYVSGAVDDLDIFIGGIVDDDFSGVADIERDIAVGKTANRHSSVEDDD